MKQKQKFPETIVAYCDDTGGGDPFLLASETLDGIDCGTPAAIYRLEQVGRIVQEPAKFVKQPKQLRK